MKIIFGNKISVDEFNFLRETLHPDSNENRG
jgi:hypothetical protein